MSGTINALKARSMQPASSGLRFLTDDALHTITQNKTS